MAVLKKAWKPETDQVYTFDQVIDNMKTTKYSFKKMVEEGKIPHVKCGMTKWVHGTVLNMFFERPDYFIEKDKNKADFARMMSKDVRKIENN